jgi:hypothetical protein
VPPNGTSFPLELESQLPAPCTANERASLDFKAPGLGDHLEAAKDVAAFANAYGGTIIVGAVAKGEVLQFYKPLTAADSSAAQRIFEEGVRDRCRPIPRFTVGMIEHGGGQLVVVNVWPAIGQPVGIQLKKADLKKQFEDVYLYPVRAGAHTTAITPEQMHMYVDAKFRRTVIALRNSAGQRLWIAGRTQNSDWFGTATVVRVDEQKNALELRLNFEREIDYTLPLDDIEAVWRDGERIKIRISGFIDRLNWSEEADDEYKAEEVLFTQVLPLARTERRDREQKIKITSIPHPPTLLSEARTALRKMFRRRSWGRRASRTVEAQEP